MKRLLDYGKRKLRGSIQLRLTCYFLFILLPLVGASLYALYQSQQILNRQIGDRTSGAMASTMDYIDMTLRGIQESSSLIATDVDIIKKLQRAERELSPDHLLDFQHMIQQLAAIATVSQTITQASILHVKSGLMVSSRFGPKHMPSLAGESWYPKLADSNGRAFWVMPESTGAPPIAELQYAVNPNSVTLMRLMDLYNPERQGDILMLTVNREVLLKLLLGLLPSPQGKVFLLDEEDRLIAGSGSFRAEYLPEPSDPSDSFKPSRPSAGDIYTIRINENDETLLGTVVRSAGSGWSIVLVQPKRELFAMTKQVQIYLYVIIGLSFVLAVWISWVVYRGIAAPVNHLASGIKRLRMGHLDTQLAIMRNDELGYLTESFNQLAAQQRHLIRDNYEQQLRLAKTELRFLQSQMNPHFLYNTLDSIYWTAKDYGADDLGEMVLDLSHFLRLSLSKGRERFTVEETVEHLQYYLRVQQARFADRLEVEFRISDESRRVELLKLLLQPIIENAIVHGLEEKVGKLRLTVATNVEAGFLHVAVSDNGVGIPAEHLAYIQRGLAQAESHLLRDGDRPDDLFGLRNVKARLLLYYGAQADLILHSEAGRGTVVRLVIPLETKEEEGRA